MCSDLDQNIRRQSCLTIFMIFDVELICLDLGRFNFIQGQRSWYQSKAHGWFPIRARAQTGVHAAMTAADIG